MTEFPFGSITTKILWKMMKGEMPCLFLEITGLYCPGCGGTRALKALLRGEILTSILYHPLILYCVMVAFIFAISYIIYWKTKNPKFRLYLDDQYVYVGIGIIVINFVVKNYFLLAKGIDLLGNLPAV